MVESLCLIRCEFDVDSTVRRKEVRAGDREVVVTNCVLKEQIIRTGIAKDRVDLAGFVFISGELVVTAAAEDLVTACAAGDEIRAGVSAQDIVAFSTD